MTCFLNPKHPSHKELEAQIEAELKAVIEADPIFGTRYAPRSATFTHEDGWDIYTYNGRRVLAIGPLRCTPKQEGNTITFGFSREVRRLNN